MKILHLLNDGPDGLSSEMIEAMADGSEVKIIDLSKDAVPYDEIIEWIFRCDKVISW